MKKTVMEWKTARKINAVFLAVVMLFSLVGGTMYHPMTAYANSVYSISVSGDIKNGTVTTNKGNANAGDTITLSVTPDTDAELYSLSVTCEKIIESEEEVNTINPGDILNYKQITKYVVAHSIDYDTWCGGSATFKAGDDKQAYYADHNGNKSFCFYEYDEINEEYLSAHNWKCTDADSEDDSYEFIETDQYLITPARDGSDSSKYTFTMPAADVSVDAIFEGPVVYQVWDDSKNKIADAAEKCTEYTIVSDQRTWNTGWYVVNHDVMFYKDITVSGTVNLILCNGSTLTASDGIRVLEGNTLNIYGQGGNTGTLVCTGSYGCLGGHYNDNAGSISIYGGTVEAKSTYYAAGIGGGGSGPGGNTKGGNIAIYGGVVYAESNLNYGIGGGFENGYDVTISSKVPFYGSNESFEEVAAMADFNTLFRYMTTEPPTYTVTNTAMINGNVTAKVNGSAVSKVGVGETVALVVTPANGYRLKDIQASYTKRKITELSDLVALMGNAEFVGANNGSSGDFSGLTCKVNDDGDFVVLDGSTTKYELSGTIEFEADSSSYYSATAGGYEWRFSIEDNHIESISVDNTNSGNTVYSSEYPQTGAGSMPSVSLDLTAVKEGSEYSFVMPQANVKVSAEFEESPHTHSFTYAVNGATITATCTADDCPLADGKVTLTIVAPTLVTYGGTGDASATLTGVSDFNTATGLTVVESDIKYVGRGTTTYAESDTAPTAAGTYTAKITAGEKTAKVDYEITKAAASVITQPSANSLTYNGMSQELVTAGAADGGTMYYALSDSGTEPADSEFATSIPKAVNAGTYTVYYYAKGDSDHGNTEKRTLTATIGKAAHEDKNAGDAEVQAGRTEKEMDLSAYLEEGASLVKSETSGELIFSGISLSGTKLRFTVAENEGDKNGTVTLTVESTNYEDYKITIAVHSNTKITEVVLENAEDGAETSVSNVEAPELSEYTEDEEAAKVEVKLTVKPESEETVEKSIGAQAVAEIKDAVSDAFSGMNANKVEKEYLDMTITKKIGDGAAQEIKDIDRVLEIAVSYDLTGKYHPVIIREHEKAVSRFTRLSERPQNGYKDGTFYTNGTDTIWIYARYFSTYTIAYATADSVQITFDDGTTQTQVIVEKGGKVKKPTDPVKNGYTFTGWQYDDNGTKKAFDFNSAVTDDLVLTAGWKEASSSGGTTPVTPGKTTPAKPAAPTLESKTDTTITVKVVDGQEYSIDGGKTWQTSGTFTGLTPEMEYSIVTKITATSTANESPVSDALKVTTDKKADSPTPTPSVPGSTTNPPDKPTETPGSTTTPTGKPTETPSSTTQPTYTPSTTTTPGATDTPSTTTTPVDKVTKAENAKAKLSLNAGLKVSYVGKKVTVKWGKVSKADRYEIYAAYCGPDKCTKIKSVSGSKQKYTFTKLNRKKLNLKKHVKVYVVVYRKVNGKETKLAKSITAHVVGTKNTKYTNAKKIKLSKSSYTLKVNKTATVKAEIVLEDKKKKQLSDGHAPEFRYASSNTKVATVDENGKIKAVGKGTCYIYVYAKNGYAKRIKVTVK